MRIDVSGGFSRRRLPNAGHWWSITQAPRCFLLRNAIFQHICLSQKGVLLETEKYPSVLCLSTTENKTLTSVEPLQSNLIKCGGPFVGHWHENTAAAAPLLIIKSSFHCWSSSFRAPPSLSSPLFYVPATTRHFKWNQKQTALFPK